MKLTNTVLFVTWQCSQTRTIHPVARLLQVTRERGSHWEFAYVEGVRGAEAEGFVPFTEFPDASRVYESEQLFPLFTNRLTGPSRPDFLEHLHRLGLPEQVREPVTILTRSGGSRATDRLEVFGLPVFEPGTNAFVYRFFVRGVRHQQGAEDLIAGLGVGDQLAVRPEPGNPVSDLALSVHEPDDQRIGYVPHYLVDDMHTLLQRGAQLSAFVDRINLPPALVQERLLCRLVAPGLRGFEPFASATYRPISAEAQPLSITRQALVA